MTTNKTRRERAKTESLKKSIEGMRLLGEIITWNARSKTPHTFSSVVAALKDCNLNHDVARELLPRHAFARACRHMVTDRMIDVLRETTDVITFQFTKKYMDEGEREREWKFAKETLVSLNKTTGRIQCPIAEMEAFAQRKLNEALDTRTTSDITRIVQKLFESEADLFPIRDQGGAYFVPLTHSGFVDRVSLFLDKLGGCITRFPVPSGTQHGDKAVQDTVSSALELMIEDHNQAIETFTLNTRQGTIEHAAEKIKATRVKIEAYASYLSDRREQLLKSVEIANRKLVETIETISKQREELPEPERNGEPVGKDAWGCRIGSQAALINAALTKEGQTIEEIAEQVNLPPGRVKSHLMAHPKWIGVEDGCRYKLITTAKPKKEKSKDKTADDTPAAVEQGGE